VIQQWPGSRRWRFESRAAWSAVKEVRVTERDIFFHADWPQSFLAPKAAFPSDDEFKEFANKAKQLRGVATAGTGITATALTPGFNPAAIESKFPPGQ